MCYNLSCTSVGSKERNSHLRLIFGHFFMYDAAIERIWADNFPLWKCVRQKTTWNEMSNVWLWRAIIILAVRLATIIDNTHCNTNPDGSCYKPFQTILDRLKHVASFTWTLDQFLRTHSKIIFTISNGIEWEAANKTKWLVIAGIGSFQAIIEPQFQLIDNIYFWKFASRMSQIHHKKFF